MNCPHCTATNLRLGENGALINPGTEQGHICNPGDRYIRAGKWKGYAFKEMVRIRDNEAAITQRLLAELREKFRSPYAP